MQAKNSARHASAFTKPLSESALRIYMIDFTLLHVSTDSVNSEIIGQSCLNLSIQSCGDLLSETLKPLLHVWWS